MKKKKFNGDWINDQRSALAEKTLAPYGPKTEGIDTAITDALANFRHLCDREGLCYGDLDRMAHVHYLEELES